MYVNVDFTLLLVFKHKYSTIHHFINTFWHLDTLGLYIVHSDQIFMEVHKRHILFLHCTKNIIDKTSSTFKTIYNSFSDNSMFKILYLILKKCNWQSFSLQILEVVEQKHGK